MNQILPISSELLNNEELAQQSIENSTKVISEQLYGMFRSPLALVKAAKKFGAQGVKRFFGVCFSFIVVNLILFFYALVQVATHDFSFINLVVPLVILVAGFICTVVAIKGVINFMRTQAIKGLYEHLAPVVEMVSNLVMEKASPILDQAIDVSKNKLAPALNVAAIVQQNFKKMPKFLKNGLVKVLNMVPFVGFLQDIQNKALQYGDGAMSEIDKKKMLYNKVNNFVQERVLADGNTRWIWWMLFFNVAGAILLITLVVGY